MLVLATKSAHHTWVNEQIYRHKAVWLHNKRIFCSMLLYSQSTPSITDSSFHSFSSLPATQLFIVIIRCKTVNSIYLSNISCSHGFIRLYCIVTQTQARKMTQHRSIFSFNLPNPCFAAHSIRNNKLRWSFLPELRAESGWQNEKYVAHGWVESYTVQNDIEVDSFFEWINHGTDRKILMIWVYILKFLNWAEN